MTRGVWTLTIWTKTPLRLGGVAVGPSAASLHSLRQLSAALDQVPGRGAPGVREGVHHA